MNKQRVLFGVSCCLILIAVPSTFARSTGNETTACFVVLDSPAVLMHQHQLSGNASIKTAAFKAKRLEAQKYEQTVMAQQSTLVQQISTIDGNARVVHRFNRLVNALAMEIDPANWDAVRNLPGVAYVAPIHHVKPFMTKSVDLMNLPQAWDEVGLGGNEGDGVFIAIIDSGIDITHPAFNPEGFTYPEGFPKGNTDFTTEKVIAARVFPPEYGNKGDTSSFDRMGHGTNVASIAAANRNSRSPLGIVSGVAPKAQLGSYKIFTSDTSDDNQVIQAIESAMEDGADVLNMSFGVGLFSDPQHDLQIVAIRNAIALGAVVVIAAGNDGNEDFSVGSPGQVEEAISVGSITNSHYTNGNPDEFDILVSAYYADGTPIVENSLTVVGAKGGPFVQPLIGTFSIQDLDLLDGGDYGSLTDGLACQSLTLSQPIEDWVLVTRGDCTFVSKINAVQQAGAKGVIFLDNKTNDPPDWPTVEGTTLPCFLLDQKTGYAIKNALKDGSKVIVDIQGVPITDNKQEPNRLSTYSGCGPSMHYSLKPDVLAIGEGSFAGTQNDDTYQTSFIASGFIWMAGTSMAAPRVTGLAAILRQVHPEWPPAWIKSAISLSARKPVLTKSGRNTTVLERGAGIVDAKGAVEVDTVVDPVLINLGAHMILNATAVSRWITVVNPTKNTCSYTLFPANTANPHGIIISNEQFELQPGEKIEIEITLPSLLNLPAGDLEGELLLTNVSTDRSYDLTYWARIYSVQTPSGDVLLIDDDGGKNYEEYYMSRMDEIGVSFTDWDVKSAGYPTLDYLTAFKSVVWFLSDNTLNSFTDKTSSDYRRTYNPRMLFQTELMKYLVGGGTLLLSGQDFSDDQETSAFSQQVLAVSFRDQQDGASTIQGIADNPVSDGLGPFTMTFSFGFENWTDYLTVLDPNQTQRAFVADGSRAKTVGVTIDTCSYRAVFLAFPLEALESSAGALLLRKSLNWLSELSEKGVPEAAKVSPSTLNTTDSPGPYPIQIGGSGFAFKTGYRAYLDFIPISDFTREDCNTLTGNVPAGIEPGTYTLHLITGDGRELRLENALTVLGSTGTNVLDWALY